MVGLSAPLRRMVWKPQPMKGRFMSWTVDILTNVAALGRVVTADGVASIAPHDAPVVTPARPARS